MTNAQSKLMTKMESIPLMGRQMIHSLRQVGVVSKHAKTVRVKVDVEEDTDDIGFWNRVVSEKKQIYVHREGI